MTLLSSEPTQSLHPLFKIKGRMIPGTELADRLKNLCLSLGFGAVSVHLDGFPGADSLGTEAYNAVYVVSTKVTYNPKWGGCCGLPSLLEHHKNKNSLETTTADFIAPFLHRYRFAQENIFLSQDEKGQYLITVPDTLLQQGAKGTGCRLRFHLEHIVETERGKISAPRALPGSTDTYAVSPQYAQSFTPLIREWQRRRKLSIGQYLAACLFSFEIAEGELASDSPYARTILPHLAEIVTHPNPNLRAAEIHLQETFAQYALQLASRNTENSHNFMLIAGIDIDMTLFGGDQEHFFVPWKAYVKKRGEGHEVEEFSLAQDELFVQMMQQETLLLV